VRLGPARFAAASIFAVALLALSAAPAAARETLDGPIVIQIVGANGQVRDFLAESAQDDRAVLALIQKLSGNLKPPADAIAQAAFSLPHYEIGIGQFAYVTVMRPVPATTLIYYPGGEGQSFLMLESGGRNASDGSWFEPTPEIASLLQRHLQGLPPIGAPGAGGPATTPPWELIAGSMVLATLALILWEDRRRWRRGLRR
jgi:hypothetical protein